MEALLAVIYGEPQANPAAVSAGHGGEVSKCHLPPGLHTWGWALQLYAARSRGSWGIGDFADLRRVAAWTRGLGGGMLMVNPLHHGGAISPPQASPYYPSSRRFRNPIYLAIEELPGAAEMATALDPLGRAGRDLNAERIIDRGQVFDLKLRALDHLWGWWREHAGSAVRDELAAYHHAGGEALEEFAVFCALEEVHGRPWQDWPAELRRPGPAARAAAPADRVEFHAWLQWLVDTQLAAAARELPLVTDLAVGSDPGGADGWSHQDLYLPGFRVGAPPDEFNPHGQDWGFQPLNPRRLGEAAGIEALAATFRAGLRHAGGLRLDHVMGAFRLWVIPEGAPATEGAYVTYPSDRILDALAEASREAAAWVVGEDLGTVSDEVREALRSRDILSYRLLWFEDSPERLPERAMSAVTTHDLPTIAGMWTGADYEAQARIGVAPPEEAHRALRERLQGIAGVASTAGIPEVVEAFYAALARSPSMVLAGTLDDALQVRERPNMPGTTAAWPNWSLALPRPLEEIEDDPLVTDVARLLGRR